jgi:hypothetical protein
MTLALADTLVLAFFAGVFMLGVLVGALVSVCLVGDGDD